MCEVVGYAERGTGARHRIQAVAGVNSNRFPPGAIGVRHRVTVTLADGCTERGGWTRNRRDSPVAVHQDRFPPGAVGVRHRVSLMILLTLDTSGHTERA